MSEISSTVTDSINKIEKVIYAKLKPLGFRKHGRTLHRFVSEDISQVINFQCGQAYRDETYQMCVNLGIRIPECSERAFFPTKPQKKFYHEYECTIRSRLGRIDGNEEKCFDLRENIETITAEILDDIINKVLPVFNILSSRQEILAHRRECSLFDTIDRHLILLEESMIYGHLGNTDKAKELFEEYYQSAVDKYNEKMKNGTQMYLKKGQQIKYMGQEITADEDGYVTVYGASHGHIDYLDQLAVKLRIR